MASSLAREHFGVLVAVALFLIVLLLLPSFVGGVAFCPRGRGYVNSTDGLCSCISGRHGAACEYKYCPHGPSWIAPPVANNQRNMQLAECSDMGSCDPLTGECTCRPGYDGRACERWACPTTITIRPTHTPTRDATREPTNEPTFSAIQIGFSGDGLGPSNIDPNIDIRSVPPCSGHGRCKTMREAGENFDGRNLVRPPVGYNNWDADKIQGCLCDEGWGGYACSERQCPFGKDPMQADYYKSPTYVLQCRANVGFFVMQIFGRWTDAIPYDADPGYLKFAIESVYDDSSVLIKMPASSSDGLPHVCGEDEIISTDIIFEELAGSLPPLLLTLNTSNTRRWPNGGTQLRLNRRSPILRMSTEHILTCPPCPNCYGNIYFIYEDSVSSAINVTIDGAKSAIERAILELDDLVEGGWTNLVVNVTIGDDSPSVADVDRVCSPTTTVTTRISLFSDYGNLPFLSILDGTYGGEFDPNSANITLTTNDGNGTLYECSNQGSCDRIRGRCQCFSALNYGEFQYRAFSSNGRGELGTRGDCGVMQINTDNCIVAGKDICAPNGFCLANTTRTCQCYDGWYGLTCNRRGCPKGRSFFGEPRTSVKAHELAECSNMGSCDSASGICNCRAGFSGIACQRFDCVRDDGTGDVCNGHGSCLSIHNYYRLFGYSYGDPENLLDDATWDAFNWHECICSAKRADGHVADIYRPSVGPNSLISGKVAGSVPLLGWGNWDCSLRNCPIGATVNRRTDWDAGELDQQRVQCYKNPDNFDDYFELAYYGERTAKIYADYDVYQIKAAIELTALIGNVSVWFPNFAYDNISTACHPQANATQGGFIVRFDTELGAQPLLENFASDVNVTVTKFVQGRNTREPCGGSAMGFCNRITGTCACNAKQISSNGTSGPGSIGDCSYLVRDSLPSDPVPLFTGRP